MLCRLGFEHGHGLLSATSRACYLLLGPREVRDMVPSACFKLKLYLDFEMIDFSLTGAACFLLLLSKVLGETAQYCELVNGGKSDMGMELTAWNSMSNTSF